ncbi:virulence membrane protein PagC [Xenorhabdus beddingii]|uniref:Virulence membrane protein PagC n=1 Tax=Xenorhabdus beddingii TaxID=40578 RepID=A0A1Y2SQ08_9GAMM|nr:outer membrane beta-barrel protein [Xenorhabdus beddingii]OTA21166.1 virulence membrane protein PagC [Xenorhabdus beddingii]
MNKILIALFVPFILLVTQVNAVGGQTASMGYASGHFDKIGGVGEARKVKSNGMNFNHHYQISPDWGVAGSFAWLKGDKNWNYSHSLLAGPTYRVNHYFSLYGVMGMTDLNWGNGAERGSDSDRYSYSDKNTVFTWGTGALINPLENLAFYILYTETRLQPENENYYINGLNIGVGYHF